MEILCFDASGSTMGCTNYWNAVQNLAKTNKFDAFLSWSSTCIQVTSVLENRKFGGTSPSAFMAYILNKFDKNYIASKYGKDAELVLQVTTDGQIYDGDISVCAEYLKKPNFPRVKKITVHYIGEESAMNFGLNAIFGSVAELSYTVNDINTSKKVPSVAELENYDDIFTPEFVSFLCSRVTSLKTDDYDAFDRLRNTLLEKIKSKKQKSEEIKPISIKEYYETGDAKGAEKAIKEAMFDAEQVEFQSWKNKILSCFDKCASISIADTRAKAKLKSTVLSKPRAVAGYKFDDMEEIIVEDSITFENIDQGKICILVKFDQPALFKYDSKFVKNPFLILQDDEVRTQMIKRFELHPLSIESVKQLTESSVVKSPFTRDVCRAFILGPANTNEINFNSQALASFFESEHRNKIYGNKQLWQLVVLYLLKTYVDSIVQKDESVAWPRDEFHTLLKAIFREYILNEKLFYHLTLHVRIQLPVERVPLYIAFWYMIHVAPFYATNSTRNLLRYPYGSVLLKLFKDADIDDKVPLDDVINKRLNFKMKLWALWEQMLVRRKDLDFKLTTRAGYQNYCIVQNKIVLLSGRRPAELPAPDIVSGIPPSVVHKMWLSLNSKSNRFSKIDQDGHSLKPPRWISLWDDRAECQEVYHMIIDPKTLRPYETCPITIDPMEKCRRKFDIKSESYARIFSLYCAKYKKYPDNSEQLILLHNRKRALDNVSSRFIAYYMEHVFDIYQPFACVMPCAEFVQKYNLYGGTEGKWRKALAIRKNLQKNRVAKKKFKSSPQFRNMKMGPSISDLIDQQLSIKDKVRIRIANKSKAKKKKQTRMSK